MSRRACLAAAPIILPLLWACSASAGVLNEIEKGGVESSAENSAPSKAGRNNRDDSDCVHGNTDCEDDDDLDDWLSLFHEIGGRTSFLRWSDEAGKYGLIPRQAGEPMLPMLRFGVDYSQPARHVSRTGFRAEVGFAAFGLEIRQHRYRESRPRDSLDILQAQLLYRMSLGSHVNVNIGAGSFTMSGDYRQSGGMVSLPIVVRLHRDIFAEARFTSMHSGPKGWQETELSLVYSPGWESLWQVAALRFGYRKFSTNTVALEGPWLGLEFIL